MHTLRALKLEPDLNSLVTFLEERLENSRNLVYYASGRAVKEAYFLLPFDNIVLVDYAFSDVFSVKGKVITIGLTALEATAVFKEAGVRFDAFVCINEGLWEGGGSYPIQGNWSMSTILPVLKEEYLHIACPEYYGKRKWKKIFNLPQKAILLSEKEEGYIDPTIFSDYYRYGKEFCVWRVSKQVGTAASFMAGTRKIIVQRKNIWDDYSLLDRILVRCPPKEVQNLLKNTYKAVPLSRDHTAKHILEFCNANKVVKLGLSPWRNGQYNTFIKFLKENEEMYPYPKELFFYHLHKNDFQQLYMQAGVNPHDGIRVSKETNDKMVEPVSNFSSTKRTKILFLHGYGSPLTIPKRQILEQYGEVVAPSIEYQDKNYFPDLLELAEKADIIIGSSFGGHTGHLLSSLFNKPALLFNPAFVKSIPQPDLREVIIPNLKSGYTQIVLGKTDTVIPFQENLTYITKELEFKSLTLTVIDDMEHRVPENILAEQMEKFIKASGSK
ncbi:YqiA/YcfP family alpha/beta fold hydrolase [Rufibacter roseolus]|uniref:YqiA/YcfP family alpha/beta fold hydrolase n=1 Tax=Rufibacter roseolus TaxID=2817375 RepID=UPI001B30DED9|nr:YqiA/YcfP family alpha/beta fold hydrolase [Rufibacter roseolus]